MKFMKKILVSIMFLSFTCSVGSMIQNGFKESEYLNMDIVSLSDADLTAIKVEMREFFGIVDHKKLVVFNKLNKIFDINKLVENYRGEIVSQNGFKLPALDSYILNRSGSGKIMFQLLGLFDGQIVFSCDANTDFIWIYFVRGQGFVIYKL